MHCARHAAAANMRRRFDGGIKHSTAHSTARISHTAAAVYWVSKQGVAYLPARLPVRPIACAAQAECLGAECRRVVPCGDARNARGSAEHSAWQGACGQCGSSTGRRYARGLYASPEPPAHSRRARTHRPHAYESMHQAPRAARAGPPRGCARRRARRTRRTQADTVLQVSGGTLGARRGARYRKTSVSV